MPLIPQLIYISIFDADDYFSARLNSEAWNEASPGNKLAALVTATRAVDKLNYVGVKADKAQPLEFPRNGQTAVPAEVLVAVCEEAVALLDGEDIELEIDGLGVATTTYAGVRETYDRTTVSESLRAGIASNVAWNFLVPWLADALSINLCRV